MVNKLLKEIYPKKVEDPYKLDLDSYIEVVTPSNTYKIGEFDNNKKNENVIIIFKISNKSKGDNIQYLSKSETDVYNKLKTIIIENQITHTKKFDNY